MTEAANVVPFPRAAPRGPVPVRVRLDRVEAALAALRRGLRQPAAWPDHENCSRTIRSDRQAARPSGAPGPAAEVGAET